MAFKRRPWRPTKKPMRQISEKRLAQLREAGLPVNSTFTPRQRAGLDRKTSRPKPAVSRDVRDTLKKRAGEGFWCEIQMTGCLGQGIDPSHRITTKSGGRHGAAKVEHDRLSDLLWACRSCHDWIGDHPAAAKAERVGWALEEWQQPTEWPVLYRGRLVYLDDLGGVHDFEEACA
jgi:hypothetical protein